MLFVVKLMSNSREISVFLMDFQGYFEEISKRKFQLCCFGSLLRKLEGCLKCIKSLSNNVSFILVL